MTRNDETNRAKLAGEVVLTGLLAVPGVTTGNPELAVLGAGATPLALAGLNKALGPLRNLRLGQAAVTLDVASSTTGIDIDDLIGRLLADRNRAQLLAEVLNASATATLDETIKALGRCIATGALADDDTAVSTEVAFVAALADIERPHLRVLTWMESDPEKPGHLRNETRARISEACDLDVAGRPVLAALERHGLVYEPPAGTMWDVAPEPTLLLTDFGLECLQRLRDAAGEGQPLAPLPTPRPA
jgi:hypothetical protein